MKSPLLITIATVFCCQAVSAWGNNKKNGNDNGEDLSTYGNALDRDWLYDGSAISMKVEGCMWGYVDDNEESGCLEDSSEDGTSSWYQMANCRRAQVVFSLYSSNSCNKNSFKESVSTKTTLAFVPFVHLLTIFFTVCY